MKLHAWPAPPAPGADELLSSYLSRVALRYGMTPTRFCAYHVGHTNVWTRDVDRSATDALCQAIATMSALPIERVQAMTMREVAQRISPERSPVQHCRTSQRWVNVLSIYHRIRRGYGLQYCPACLSESGYFRRVWRMSFHTVCPVHRSMFLDACPSCGSPIMLHRHQVSLLRCHQCGRHLQRFAADSAISMTTDFSAVLALADRFQSACDQGFTVMGDQRLSTDAFLGGAHFLMRQNGLWERQQETGTPGPRTLEMEHCRVPERHRRLERLGAVLRDWPVAFLREARSHDATQRSLLATGVPPKWIAAAAEALPEGIPHDRTRRPLDFRNRLRALHRLKQPGWRGRRAEILLLAGGAR